MTVSSKLTVDLAHYRSISNWKPEIGDVIIWHGLFQHWFGVIIDISNTKITITKAGIPKLLVTMSNDEISKNSLLISIDKIRLSKGAYTIQRPEQQAIIWYI